MSQLLSHPAFWAFWSALVYAGTVLSNGLWLAEPAPDHRRRKYLIASFVLAMVVGPLAAEVMTADVAGWMAARFGKPPGPHAIAVGIGLFAAPLWPLVLRLARLRIANLGRSLT